MGLFLAALVNLDHYGRYLTWHFISISLANFVVIVTMVVVFIAALLLPFPGRRERGAQHDHD
jgi:high-affinity Fe2+/Pb2+ permease